MMVADERDSRESICECPRSFRTKSMGKIQFEEQALLMNSYATDNYASQGYELPRNNTMLVNSCYVSRQIKRPRDSSVSAASNKNNQVESEPKESDDVQSQKKSESSQIDNYVIPEIYLRKWGCSSVLIVDDSAFNILILHEIFEKLIPPELSKNAAAGSPKFTIDEATNGLQAVEKVKSSRKKFWWRGYEVIFMDLNMPVMDGATATTNIVRMQKAGLVCKELKVVALTAYDSPEHKTLWMNSGMKEFLNKPVSIDNIMRVLSKS